MSSELNTVNNQHIELTKEGFAALLDSAVDAMVIIGSSGEILNFNRAAQILFGYRPDETILKNVKMLMPSPYHEEHDSYLKNYKETGEKKVIGIGRKVQAQKKDGSVFPIMLSVGEYAEGNNHYYIGMIRDLTQQLETEQLAKEFRDRLAHVDRISTLGEMAAGIAHELNQPLAAISSYAQAAQRRIKGSRADPEKMIELLSKVEAQALRAGKVIERMRSLSKTNDTLRDRVRLNDVVKNAIDLIEPEAISRGVPLQTEYMKQNLEIMVDSVQIQQVVLNLVRNAIDATEEAGDKSGPVTIRTQINKDSDAEIIVQDQGVGISDEIRARLFHPFVTSKNYGTGLGLSISQSIVDAHGGSLLAEDANPGSVFRFSIPIVTGSDD